MVHLEGTKSSAAAGRVVSSAIRDLLSLAGRSDIISLAGGMPAAESFPTARIAAAIAGVLEADPAGALQYSATEGFMPLREWVALRHGTDPERVLITSGSQQALELAVRASVDPGDPAALADPGYVGAIQSLRLVGARLVGIPGDGHGMLVDELGRRLAEGLRPALVHVVPNFDNPTGSSLSEERSQMLAELAEHYGFIVVEDDPYRQLRWSGSAPPPMATLCERVVSLGSFSKILCPGLRVGYAIGPPATIRAMALVKQAADLHTATLNQRATLRVLAEPGFLDHHLRALRSLYAAKATALTDALRARLGDVLEFRDPEGGMFVWAQVTSSDVDAEELLGAAIDHGVAFVPGAAFAVEDRFPRHLRLSFATAPTEQLIVAVERLAGALAGSPPSPDESGASQ